MCSSLAKATNPMYHYQRAKGLGSVLLKREIGELQRRLKCHKFENIRKKLNHHLTWPMSSALYIYCVCRQFCLLFCPFMFCFVCVFFVFFLFVYSFVSLFISYVFVCLFLFVLGVCTVRCFVWLLLYENDS